MRKTSYKEVLDILNQNKTNKTIYDEVLEMLEQNKEVELYRFRYSMPGTLDVYTNKVYTAEDGEKITKSKILTSVSGSKFALFKIKCVGIASIKGKSYIVREYPTYDMLSFDEINKYSFSIMEAIDKIATDKSYSYLLGEDDILYELTDVEKNKNGIELLLSNGLISKLEDFNELENEKRNLFFLKPRHTKDITIIQNTKKKSVFPEAPSHPRHNDYPKKKQ